MRRRLINDDDDEDEDDDNEKEVKQNPIIIPGMRPSRRPGTTDNENGPGEELITVAEVQGVLQNLSAFINETAAANPTLLMDLAGILTAAGLCHINGKSIEEKIV